MTTGASAFFAALFACHAALAQTPWGVPELMAELRAVRAVRATFAETKYLHALTRPLELSGTLAYRAPDWLEKHTLAPYDERLVLDGDTLTIADAKQRRSFPLERNPPVQAFVESIRSTLAGDLDTLQRFYDVRLSGERGRWRLVLVPTDATMQSLVTEILLGGRDAWVETIEIHAAGGDRTVMTVSPVAQ
jgi:outer membrane lipoprotein-sorting protein